MIVFLFLSNSILDSNYQLKNIDLIVKEVETLETEAEKEEEKETKGEEDLETEEGEEATPTVQSRQVHLQEAGKMKMQVNQAQKAPKSNYHHPKSNKFFKISPSEITFSSNFSQIPVKFSIFIQPSCSKTCSIEA